ncbi:hypothetical protein MCT03_15815 [Vibrio aestuarianus]|nr:hypothetical protein [Vibrio aestuarianus]
MKLKLLMLSSVVSCYGIAHAQTSAFEQAPRKNNQVLVSLPNQYDASDIIKVEVNDQSYLSVHYRNKTTGRNDSVWCARYTNTGLVKTADANKPVTKPLCDAGIAAFNKAAN